MKIDVSTIEGYEQMTAEEKLKALESIDIDIDYTGYVKKDAFDKATSEAAAYKKQLRERQTAEETATQEVEERMQAIEAENKALKYEKQVTEYTNNLLSIGYEGKMASATAKAMADGDMATVFKNHAAHIASVEQAVKAEVMNSTSTPPPGDGTRTKTKADLAGMSLAEKQAFASEHPDEYKAIYSE